MRTIRALTIAVAVVAALPAVAAAQRGRQFDDAWFWGVKAGGLTVADTGGHLTQAPMAGVEMLITRHNGGLYISGGEAFFTRRTLTFRDPNAQADSGFRVIDMKNMRKLDVAVMGFPGNHLRWHPYVGAGFSLGQIANARPREPFDNEDQLAYADSVISQHKVAFSPLFMAGVQYRLTAASVFGQLSFIPTHQDFLLANGRSSMWAYEIGVRYNVGTSIDRNP